MHYYSYYNQHNINVIDSLCFDRIFKMIYEINSYLIHFLETQLLFFVFYSFINYYYFIWYF